MSHTPEQPKKILKSFSATLRSCKYTFKNGVVAHFINGIYRTDRQNEIDELTEEVTYGNPYFSFASDVIASEVDNLANLRERLKKEAIAEYLAEQARIAAANEAGNRDFGNTGAVNKAPGALTSGGGATTAASKLQEKAKAANLATATILPQDTVIVPDADKAAQTL